MRIDKIYIEKFKNLKDFSINLDETKMHTVLLGQNAAGKIKSVRGTCYNI